MYLTDVTSDRLGSVTSRGPSLRLLVEVTACVLLSSHGKRAAVVLLPCLLAINSCDVLQKWIIKRVSWPTKIKVQQRKKEVNTGSEIQIKH